MFSAYTSTYGNNVEPYSRLSCSLPAEMIYSWIAETMGLKETGSDSRDEYHFLIDIWNYREQEILS